MRLIDSEMVIERCTIVECRYHEDLYTGLPVCRSCMVNTVRRLLNKYGDSVHLHTFEEVEAGIISGKDDRINSAYSWGRKNIVSLVRMENHFFKVRGYDPEQYK